MKTVIKQVLGIDVSKKELIVCLGKMDSDLQVELCAHAAFANTEKGFAALQKWAVKFAFKDLPLQYVMEATGVYHEALTYFLDSKGEYVSVILPNKINNYARTLTVKTVTDKTASQAIAQFGLSRPLDKWMRPSPVCKKIKQLTRERDQLMNERTIVKNQLHAEQSEAEPNKFTVNRMKKRIVFLNKQDEEIKKELLKLLKSDEKIGATVSLLTSITGIGEITAAIVIAETNCFEHVRNRRQLASYAGLDVKEKQSGTSVKGKSRISKKGNRYLRKALHMSALTAIKYDSKFKAVFDRLVARHGIKMKAIVAVQRQLLEMMFAVHKTRNRYDPNFMQNQVQEMKIN
ncbi:MAG TPA: transposase [Pedobacter sp.]|uniref:transposase n=1 Tax=Pedobacter sp. TaxID=1411316 RepID=UPI002BC09CA5|nr:transposase [Pedobacter sp.]HMI01695.1 transposase [Pedobacter sp.]